MAIGLFLDKAHLPGPEEIRSALGAAAPLWDRLIYFMLESYQLPGDLSYGGKKYGWNLWYRKGGKSLTSIYPQAGCFIAQVVLGKDQCEKALALSLGENTGKTLRESPQLHDGRWLFITVSTERDEEDVEQLLMVKKKPSRRL